jgi:cytochrome c oxidase subunit IV
MSAQFSSSEITFHPEHASDTKRIWRTFWILSILTIIELAIGLVIYNMHKGEHPNSTLVLGFKGMVCILTMAKAYYIVSIFMHLGDEVRNMIMTIVVPLCLFIWFIIAFLYDGNSWKNLRNRYNGKPAVIENTVPVVKEKGAKD